MDPVTRNYDESLFVVTSIDNVKQYTCSMCVELGKVKPQVYKDPLRPFNVKRHWLTVHKIVLVTGASNSLDPAVLSNAPTPAAAKALLLRCHLDSNLALQTWNRPSYRALAQPYVDKCNIKVSSAAMRRYLRDAHKETTAKISARLKHRMFSVQFDIASRKGRTLLGISAQFVDHKTFKQEVITIGMVHLKATGGLVLKQKMEECLAQYGLSITQVYSYTTDNGKNVLKATRELLRESEKAILEDTQEQDAHDNYGDTDNVDDVDDVDDVDEDDVDSVDGDDEDDDSYEEEPEPAAEAVPAYDHDWDEALIRCAAHTVQLAVNDVLKPMDNKLKNIRGQVKLARDQLKKKGMPMPPLSNITRYASLPTTAYYKKIISLTPPNYYN